MKICLYSPYIPKHFGGGEKYLLDVAQVLSRKHQVVLAIPASHFNQTQASEIKRAYQDYFQIDLSRVELVSSPIGASASAGQKIWWTKQFDAFYYLTDGSLFFSLAGKNILHIQIPFTRPQSGIVNHLKLANWSIKNTNSQFTKQVIEKAWQTQVNLVHHPLIEMPWPPDAEPLLADKQPIILSVGRFFRQLHAKRQDVLIEMFRMLSETRPRLMKEWKLVLIGASEDDEYVRELHAAAAGLAVEFYHNLNHDQLLDWYRQASIYWHAAGFEVDQTQHPEKVEHFGISTVEAMAAAAAPVVIGKGGQVEILGPELTQWLWQTPAEGCELTKLLLENNQLRGETQTTALKRAQVFNRATFEAGLSSMLGTAV